MVNVVWLSYHPDIRARGYADQFLVEWAIEQVVSDAFHATTIGDVPDGAGAIVVVPARHHVRDVERLNAELARLPWALVVLCGDEDAEFPWQKIAHSNHRLWVQTPDPRVHAGAGRFFGDGPSAWLPSLRGAPVPDKTLPWFFAGQLTHDARWRCHAMLRRLQRQVGGEIVGTQGFMQGLPGPEYLERMLRAKVVPAPGGPITPDTLRLFEALEVGAVPVADGDGYWRFLFGDVPFPVVADWLHADGAIAAVLADWLPLANRCFAWWQGVLRDLRVGLTNDLAELGAPVSPEAVTVLVPTSPIPAHPDTSIIETTLTSIRAQLPRADILVLIDGVRAEQEHLRAPYEEYVRRLLWVCRHHYRRVTPVLHESHCHQAAMTRRALDMVQTPLVLFVEHDCPVYEAIPWDGLADAVLSGRANVIRLLHESSILPEHRHLVLDEVPQGDPPLVRTTQWSQRPHLATTAYYRWLIAEHFADNARTMIEDVVHGIADHYGRLGDWQRFGIAIFAPAGDMKRSWHLDGRGSEPKYGMHFAYPHEDSPPGAPWPTHQGAPA